jgi:hypothetical protein
MDAWAAYLSVEEVADGLAEDVEALLELASAATSAYSPRMRRLP